MACAANKGKWPLHALSFDFRYAPAHMGISSAVLLAKVTQERRILLGSRRTKAVVLALIFLALGSLGQSLVLRHFGAGEVAGVYHLRITGYLFFVCASFVLAQGAQVNEQQLKLLALRGLAQPGRLSRVLPNFLGTFSWLIAVIGYVSFIPYMLLFKEAALARHPAELIQFILQLSLLIIGFSASVALTRSLSQLLFPKRSVLISALIWLAPLCLELLILQQNAESFFSTSPRSLPGLFFRSLYQLNADYLRLC